LMLALSMEFLKLKYLQFYNFNNNELGLVILQCHNNNVPTDTNVQFYSSQLLSLGFI